MLEDVVVDANIFAHAQNPKEKHCDAAAEFLERLLQVNTKLCLDGYFEDGPRNSSLIGQEYLNSVQPTGKGYAFLVKLLSSGRVKMGVSRKVPPNVRKIVADAIPKNNHDRTLVFVSYNSASRVVVSHDYMDFPKAVRGRIRKELGVVVEMAAEATDRLGEGSNGG